MNVCTCLNFSPQIKRQKLRVISTIYSHWHCYCLSINNFSPAFTVCICFTLNQLMHITCVVDCDNSIVNVSMWFTSFKFYMQSTFICWMHTHTHTYQLNIHSRLHIFLLIKSKKRHVPTHTQTKIKSNMNMHVCVCVCILFSFHLFHSFGAVYMCTAHI